jgi:4-hydroxybenzoate polyprenyltransferase
MLFSTTSRRLLSRRCITDASLIYVRPFAQRTFLRTSASRKLDNRETTFEPAKPVGHEKLSTIQPSSLERARLKLLPYWHLARLDKPIGTVLLYLPCSKSLLYGPEYRLLTQSAWSITMACYASNSSPSVLVSNLLLFGTGAFLMRGAGCTINDMWDRNLDKGVERTRIRPLASGALTVPQATGFLGLQLAGGLAVLTQLNWFRYLLATL